MLVSGCLLVRLAILLSVLLVQSCEGQSWEAFQNKHIDYPKTQAPNPNAYCNLMMVKRKLNPTRCKPRNTFINHAKESVQEVCGSGGKPYEKNLYDSIENFPMIDCNFTDGKPPNDCKYKGLEFSRRIRVACQNNMPVHLEKLL
ncbi:ribonuclease pancreatic-like [Zootoca vivipara]|uniref:ribonuclease pancreatic-like n=1 Tax=Zootoca vivipara TaxID=8524 RepID=UPI00293BB941|nr:ribonuclease pancreatic-like [Zootoca vivipara]XP_034991656.2 ribonuclease pancreatic-like [Zootoca vivipara]